MMTRTVMPTMFNLDDNHVGKCHQRLNRYEGGASDEDGECD